MNKIICLKGRANSGKSKTLRNLLALLKSTYPNAIINILIDGSDVQAIIDIGDIKIGIESQGDPNRRLKTSLELFASLDCNIIFCTARTSGMTVEWVNSHAEKYDINFVKQTYSSNIEQQESSNQERAQQLLDLANLIG